MTGPTKPTNPNVVRIIEALDDLAAAVDGFSKRFNALEDNLAILHDRVTGLENNVDENVLPQIRKLDTTIENMYATVDNLAKDVANEVSDSLGDARELIESIDRKERQEMLLDARSGMSKVALVRLK